MNGINQIEISGNLGGDPDVRTLDSGRAVANFSVASNQKWKTKDGEEQERTTWFRVVVWGWLAEVAGRLRKGNMVYCRGEMQEREWTDKDGVERRTWEVVIGNAPGSLLLVIDTAAQFGGQGQGQRSGGFGGGRGGSSRQGFGGGQRQQQPPPAKTNQSHEFDDDEDIPF